MVSPGYLLFLKGSMVGYTSEVPDNVWAYLQSVFESYGISDKKRKHPVRNILSAIFYLADNGVKWRNLPKDFPPWKTVYHYFNAWSRLALWQEVNRILVEDVRFAGNRSRSPSLVSIDSQS
jgi:transposase